MPLNLQYKFLKKIAFLDHINSTVRNEIISKPIRVCLKIKIYSTINVIDDNMQL